MQTSLPLIIIGGFGSSWPQYRGLADQLARLSGRPVRIAPINLIDWLGVLPTDSYGTLLRIVSRAVDAARRDLGAKQVDLVAHSAGGVVSRIYLGDQAYGPRKQAYHGYRFVRSLITLGTPHKTTQRGRPGGLNQIAFAEQQYPGAYWNFIRYVSVMGRGIQGVEQGPPPERGAYQSYKLILGDGAGWGDGVVPLASGLLDGSEQIVLDGLRHDPRPDRPWYGQDEATIMRWWGQI